MGTARTSRVPARALGRGVLSGRYGEPRGGAISSCGGGGATQDSFAVRADARLNALIATGSGDKFEMVEQLIDVLDAPPGAGDARLVRVYGVENADLDIVSEVVEELFAGSSANRRWWMPADPNEVHALRFTKHVCPPRCPAAP